MAKLPEIKITKVHLIFFPVASYIEIGYIAVFRVFGLPIYKKVGDRKSLFGLKWTKHDECEPLKE